MRRVRILTYSPRTGTRSKCPQDPWGVDLSPEPNHRSRLQDAVGFFFFTTTNKQTNTHGYNTHGFIFSSHHYIKGLLFPNQKRLGPFPKKSHTPSKNDTSPSASSHMDASHSSRELNLPDSELTRLVRPPFKDFPLLRKLPHHIESVDRQAPRTAYVVWYR